MKEEKKIKKIVKSAKGYSEKFLGYPLITSYPEVAREFKLLPEKFEDEWFGRLLGYYPCCVENFKKISFEKIRKELEELKSNPKLAEYNSYTRHFPCSYKCNQAFVEGYFCKKVLEKNYPEILKQLENALGVASLCGE